MKDEAFFQSNRTSIMLEGLVKQCSTFEQFEQMCSDDMLSSDMRLGNYLSWLLRHHNKVETVVSADAYQSEGYLSHIITGRTKNPKRDVLISIAFAMGATVDECQCILKYAGYMPLYVRRKRDVIIWFGLSKGETLDEVNDNLKKHDCKPLCEEKPTKPRNDAKKFPENKK